MTKVSIIMPVYNGEKYLRESMDSALGQDLREIELICCDDGSTDGSKAIIGEYAAHDPRVRLICLDHGGAGPARNAGLDAASGEYVAFIDSDDLYPDSGTLRALYEAAVSSGCDLAGGNVRLVSSDGEDCVGQMTEFGPGLAGHVGIVSASDYQIPYGFTCFVYRRELLVRESIRFPAFSKYEDPCFFIRALGTAGRFFALKRYVYLYRVAPKVIDWSGDGYRLRRDHFAGLSVVIGLAGRFSLPRLAEVAAGDFAEAVSDAACLSATWDLSAELVGRLKRMNDFRPSDWRRIFRRIARQEPWSRRWLLRCRLFGTAFVFGKLMGL